MVGETLDVGMKCVQYMLFVANFLFVMVGLLLVSIGTIIKEMYTDFELFLETSYFSPSNLLIFCGFVIFFVAFFGCFGAMRESTLLVNIYSLCLTLILFFEILAICLAITMRVDLDTTIKTNMNNAFKKANNADYVMDIFDFTQSQLYCCGVNGISDWKQFNYTDALEPPSCCPGFNYYANARYAQTNFTCSKAKAYTTPCSKQVSELIAESAYLLTTGAICVVFIQIIGIIFARLLTKTIRNLKTQRLVEAEFRRQRIYSQIILGTTLNDNDNVEKHTTKGSEA